MKIFFSPQRRDDATEITLSRAGDALIVNGKAFDFSPLAEDHALPGAAIPSEIFSGPVMRVDGVLHINLTLPHGPNPPRHVAFPKPIDMLEDGEIEVPKAESMFSEGEGISDEH